MGYNGIIVDEMGFIPSSDTNLDMPPLSTDGK
jgi:hypothetical protein